MPDLSRFDRNLDIEDPTEVATSRFERLDQELTTVDGLVSIGMPLHAVAVDGRISISCGPNGLKGTYPTFRVGLLTLGEYLSQAIPDLNEFRRQDFPALETSVPGECPKEDPIDCSLIEGARLEVEASGGVLQATWTRRLPDKKYVANGRVHLAYQIGTRKARGSKVTEVALASLSATEVVIRGSLLSSHT